MLRDLKISVIGPGAMGEAIIGGLLRQELVAPDQILVSHPREERRHELRSRYGVEASDDNVAAAHWGRVVIFAVKPQQLKRVLPQLRGTLRDDDLAISVVAGATIAGFAQALDHPAVARSMPNTPAVIGEGMTQTTPGTQEIQIVVPDAEAARKQVLAAGVEASEVDVQPWGNFVYFRDPDGNSWSLQAIASRPNG